MAQKKKSALRCTYIPHILKYFFCYNQIVFIVNKKKVFSFSNLAKYK